MVARASPAIHARRIPILSAMTDGPRSPFSRAHYASGRWKSARALQRDPILVDRILERYCARPGLKPVLDAPCGAGRLRAVFERRGLRYVGIDSSTATLLEAQRSERAKETASSLLAALVERLPFRDDSFDVVVCCRLLHHLHDPDEIRAAVSELTRVAHRLVVASFWDSASLHALRRRVGLRRSEDQGGRRAVSKRLLRALFRESGAEVVGFYHSFRFVSQQTFVVAQKRAPAEARLATTAHLSRELLDLPLSHAPGSLGGA
jgi:ubiquinone/menaquinone biosynthesis C-methylase UbiE